MTDKRTTVTYISDKVSQCDSTDIAFRLTTELPIDFVRLDTIQEAFAKLGDSTFHTNFFTIDAELVSENGFTDMFSLINTLKTIIDSTVVRRPNGELGPRQTKILAIVGLDTDPKLIKRISKMPSIAGLTLRFGPGIEYQDLVDSCRSILNNDFSVPKKIQNLLKTKKEKTINSYQIQLTPRQEQIFSIVTQRGVSNKMIGKMLNLSESTIKLHMSAIMKKYGAKNRTQLTVFSKKNPVTAEA